MRKHMRRVFCALLALAALSAAGLADDSPVVHPLKGILKGKAVNAVSNEGIPGVTVMAGDASAVTDADGNYSILQIPAGEIVVSFAKEGYIAATVRVTVAGGEEAALDVIMSQELSSNEYRVVLDWNTGFVLDLDSHLLGKTPYGDRYHVCYLNKSSAFVKAQMDLDDRTGSRMETVTFTAETDGTYQFYVFDYTNRSDPAASVLSASGATVTVYRGNTLLRTFTVPVRKRGNCWDVFCIENGQFVPVDRFVNAEPSLAEEIPSEPAEIFPVVTFGRYEQDNDLTNGPEPIEWFVLETDGDKALLLAQYGLDAKPFVEKRDYRYWETRWELCTLRGWLNGEFLNSAFHAEEQKAILMTTVHNSVSEGYSSWNNVGRKDTRDMVFLLSYAEADRYFGGLKSFKLDGSSEKKETRVAPTAYAIAQGAWTSDSNKTVEGGKAGRWWLRSPGFDQSSAAYVGGGGSLSFSGLVSEGDVVVRPAMWVKLEALSF